MRLSFLSALCACAVALAAAAHASTISYAVHNDFSTFSVAGTITTNGKVGVLQTSDITGWSLLLVAGTQQLTLTTANSEEAMFGVQNVSATLSGLYVNYDVAGDLLFQSPYVGAGSNFVCYQGSGRNCFSNGALGSLGVNIGSANSATVYALQSGMVQIGAIAPTPEPSGLALLGTGLVGVVTLARTRYSRVSL